MTTILTENGKPVIRNNKLQLFDVDKCCIRYLCTEGAGQCNKVSAKDYPTIDPPVFSDFDSCIDYCTTCDNPCEYWNGEACVPDVYDCPSDTHYDCDLKECLPNCVWFPNPYGPGYEWNPEACDWQACTQITPCQPDEEWVQKLCRCKELCVEQECKPNFKFNRRPGVCRCVPCDILECDPAKCESWDTYSCKCLSTCTEYEKCENGACVPNGKCPPDQHWDGEKCVGDPECPPNQYWADPPGECRGCEWVQVTASGGTWSTGVYSAAFSHRQDSNCIGGGGSYNGNIRRCIYTTGGLLTATVSGRTENQDADFDICSIIVNNVTIAQIQGVDADEGCGDIDSLRDDTGSVTLAEGTHWIEFKANSVDGQYHTADTKQFSVAIP